MAHAAFTSPTWVKARLAVMSPLARTRRCRCRGILQDAEDGRVTVEIGSGDDRRVESRELRTYESTRTVAFTP
jgi:hypothetical protein